MTITNDIRYIGVNDHEVDLFEGQYPVPNGMSYNSYVILDEKIAVFDTVDARFEEEWLANIATALAGKEPDFLIIQHMEPDHSANIALFAETFPDATLVANTKTFTMLDNFFRPAITSKRLEVANMGTLSLGSHELTFIFAPMVHWPEVMVTYDSKDKVLFSADGFGKFGANDVVDPEGWDCEARRYYFGIVGKYGAQVQKLLQAASGLDIQTICPLHGPVLKEDLGHYLHLYDVWSSYEPETDGIAIAYTSVYGHTKEAAELLASLCKEKGAPAVRLVDLAREDWAENVENAFRYSKIVLASTTYNAGVFPVMKHFLSDLVERGYRNRTVGIIENGSWAPQAGKVMKAMLADCKNLTWLNTSVTIRSSLCDGAKENLEKMASELCRDYSARLEELANKNDLTALFRIGYGLYVVTCNDGTKDNGLIVNAVTQLTDNPNRVAVTINKRNFSHDVIKKTKKLNVNCLSVEAPFSVFEHFGFQSGRNVDKFADYEGLRSDNGLMFLPRYINAFLSLDVQNYIDMDTHGMFICTVSEARVMSDKDTMTYTYYQQNVKPKPKTEGKKGFVCTVCGYIYEGDELPEDFICPLCKHGAADFEPIS
ncbi:MAG: flavin reductase [Eubacterium sp.]|nr:flavin reductase [Eubacterium sp.]